MIYKEYFSKFDDVKFIDEPADARSNFWLNADASLKAVKSEMSFLKFSNENGVFYASYLAAYERA